MIGKNASNGWKTFPGHPGTGIEREGRVVYSHGGFPIHERHRRVSHEAEVLWSDPEHDATDVANVISSDLMSDVLMMDAEQPLLLSSLVSDQSLRTANVVGAVALVVANGKTPPPNMVELARELGITLARTEMAKFEASVALGKALGR